MRWQDEARCKNMDTSLFFAAQPHQAKRVCAECGVSVECLSFALANEAAGRHDGVFGGMSGDERMDLLRHRVELRVRAERVA